MEFRDESNAVYTVNAALEVIMATGAIKTPSILQQSGVGPARVLQSAGVAVRVDLPVGQNLVDQTTSTTTFGFSGQRGGGQVITFPRFQVGPRALAGFPVLTPWVGPRLGTGRRAAPRDPHQQSRNIRLLRRRRGRIHQRRGATTYSRDPT